MKLPELFQQIVDVASAKIEETRKDIPSFYAYKQLKQKQKELVQAAARLYHPLGQKDKDK